MPSHLLDKDRFSCFYIRQLHKAKLPHKSQYTILLSYLLMGIFEAFQVAIGEEKREKRTLAAPQWECTARVLGIVVERLF